MKAVVHVYSTKVFHPNFLSWDVLTVWTILLSIAWYKIVMQQFIVLFYTMEYPTCLVCILGINTHLRVHENTEKVTRGILSPWYTHESYECMIDHRSYTHNLSSCEIKA